MVDRYWRQEINSVKDDIENSMQISSILLKLKGYDKSDLSKIGDNENNISSNLSKIGDNDDDIDEIKLDLSNIKNDLSDFKINYSIQNLFIYNIDVENNYTLIKITPNLVFLVII